MNLYENTTELNEVLAMARNLPNAGEGEIPEGYIKPEGTLLITENGTKDVTNYAEVDVNVPIPTFETEEVVITPQKDEPIVKVPTTDGYSKVTVEPIPDEYIDTSDATAEPIDICIDKTAFVNGELVTGTYTSIGDNQYSSTSANCSESELVVPCNFTPKACCVVFNSQEYGEGKIISCWAILGAAIVYHSYSSTRTLSLSDYEVARSQITTNVSSYIWYSGGYLHIKRPNSTYSWQNKNYRVFAFK